MSTYDWGAQEIWTKDRTKRARDRLKAQGRLQRMQQPVESKPADRKRPVKKMPPAKKALLKKIEDALIPERKEEKAQARELAQGGIVSPVWTTGGNIQIDPNATFIPSGWSAPQAVSTGAFDELKDAFEKLSLKFAVLELEVDRLRRKLDKK